MLYAGSSCQLNGGGATVYLPDYSVRQLTPLQIIKVASQRELRPSGPTAGGGGQELRPHGVHPWSRSRGATTRTR